MVELRLNGCPCGGYFLLPRWHAVLLWGLWQCRYHQMLGGLRKFRKRLPAIITRKLSLKICSRVYEAHFRSTMFHNVQTPENCIGFIAVAIPRSAGSVTPKTETKHPQLQYYRNLPLRILWQSFTVGGSDGMASATSCIKSVTDFLIPSTRKQIRPRKMWYECAKIYVSNWYLADLEPQDRDAWKADVLHSLLLPNP